MSWFGHEKESHEKKNKYEGKSNAWQTEYLRLSTVWSEFLSNIGTRFRRFQYHWNQVFKPSHKLKIFHGNRSAAPRYQRNVAIYYHRGRVKETAHFYYTSFEHSYSVQNKIPGIGRWKHTEKWYYCNLRWLWKTSREMYSIKTPSKCH